MFAQEGVSIENGSKSETNNVPGVDRTTITRLCYNCNHHGNFPYNRPHSDRRRQNQGVGRDGVGLLHVVIKLI